MNNKKLEYIESLTLSGLRYELDKIHARIKEVERLKGMMIELDDSLYDFSLSILEEDYKLLMDELELYNRYYQKLRNG
jgi:hypothetical protein